MKLIFPALLLSPFLFSACVPETPEAPTPQAVANDTCGANRYLGLIGQEGPTISVPANTAYRSYRNGDAVTMDYNPQRLNFEHDARGTLVRVSCG